MQQEEVEVPQLQTQRESVTFDINKKNSIASRIPSMCSGAANPLTAMAHLILLIGNVFLYVMIPILTGPSNALAFMILAGAIDFYFIKNIAGRKLVGLRWWIAFGDQDVEITLYECKMDERDIPHASHTIFWYPINILCVVWVVLAIINIIAFSLPHLSICIYNFVLLRVNYKYFQNAYTTKSSHVEQLISRHGYQKITQFNRGTLVSQVD